MRDPFENNVGAEQKGAFSIGGALASPSTAYIYDWNLLPIGQLLWEKELMSYIDFPPLQLAASYNLEQVLQQVQGDGFKTPERVAGEPDIRSRGPSLYGLARDLFYRLVRSSLISPSAHASSKNQTQLF